MPLWKKEVIIAAIAPEDWRLIRASAIHRPCRGIEEEFVRWPGLNKNVPNPDEAAHDALDNLEVTRDEITDDILRKSIARLAKYRRIFGDDRILLLDDLEALVLRFKSRDKGRAMDNEELLEWCEKFGEALEPNVKRERFDVPENAGDAKYWDICLSYCDVHVATFVLDGFLEREALGITIEGSRYWHHDH